MTRPSTDHVYSDARDGGAFRCDHCGARHLPALPMPLTQYIEQGRDFALMHRLCPKPVEPSSQLALPGTNGRIVAQVTYPEETLIIERFEPGEPIDGMTDDPAPEVDPPPRRPDKFAEMYPAPRDVPALRTALDLVLSPEHAAILPSKAIPWHPDSGQFWGVAAWAMLERAHMEADARSRAGQLPIGGLYIPLRQEMPQPLRELLGLAAPKKKRGARPLTSPKKGKK